MSSWYLISWMSKPYLSSWSKLTTMPSTLSECFSFSKSPFSIVMVPSSAVLAAWSFDELGMCSILAGCPFGVCRNCWASSEIAIPPGTKTFWESNFLKPWGNDDFSEGWDYLFKGLMPVPAEIIYFSLFWGSSDLIKASTALFGVLFLTFLRVLE